MKNRKLLYLLILVPLCFWALFLGPKFFIKKNKVFLDSSNKDVLKKWEALDYINIDQSGSFKGVVDNFPVTTNAPLSELQRQQLQDTLFKFIMAFHQGGYEAYMNFRTPIGGYQLAATSVKFMRDYLENGPTIFKSFFLYQKYQNYQKRRLPDNLGADEIFKMYLREISNDTMYTNYWEGISPDSLKIIVDKMQNTTNGIANYPFFPKEKYSAYSTDAYVPNLGLLIFGQHTFVTDRSPEAVLAEAGGITAVSVFWYVKLSPPDSIKPVLARFYWDDKHSCWLPWQLGYGNTLDIHLADMTF